MVQDRSGASDGTASASGVTQVQPIIQGNLTSLAVGTGVGTPADGQIIVDGGAKTAPGYSFEHTTATGMYSPGANQIRFSTASTDRLTIDGSGDTTLAGKLKLDDASVAGWIQSNGSVRVDIDNDKDSTDRAFIISRDNASATLFSVNELGLASFSGGINLGDTTLSNYKESTWTPVLSITGGNAGGTLTQTTGALGKYVRVGKMVHVMGIINVTAASGLSGATGIVRVDGFPFAADVNETYYYQYRFNFSREDAIVSSSRKAENFISFYSSTTIGFLYDSGIGSAITGNELTTGKLIFSGSYITT